MNPLLAKERYYVIRKFINPDRAKTLAKGFIEHCEANEIGGDVMVPESSSFYNYLPFVDLLCEKTNEVSELLGERVFPAYSYSRVYRRGNSLKPHRDREESEIALTVCLDYDQEWPICFHNLHGNPVCVTLQPGDAIIYFGQELIHWRDEFYGSWSNNAFFFYVRRDGPHASNFFDRKHLGVSQYEEQNGNGKEKKKFLPNKGENKKKIDRTVIERPSIEHYVKLFKKGVSKELCDSILTEYSQSERWLNDPFLDEAGKKMQILSLDNNILTETNQIARYGIDATLHSAFSSALGKYVNGIVPVVLSEDLGYTLFRINEGGFLNHSLLPYPDPTQKTLLKLFLFLDDSGPGGEICMFDNMKPFPVEKGDVLIFPDNFLFPIGISPVVRGSFSLLLTWVK